MIMEHEERHRDTQSTIKWCEIRSSPVHERTAAFMLQLEAAAAAAVAAA